MTEPLESADAGHQLRELKAATLSYPAQYESDVVLRDGSTLRLRPVRADDEAELRKLHDRLSRESLYFRFFHCAQVQPSRSLAIAPR